MTNKILVINTGSTSTKIGVFYDEIKIMESIIRHSSEELRKYENILEQLEFREGKILKSLKENNINLNELNAIACRGGVTKPIKGGTYLVTNEVCKMQIDTPFQHPSNLSCIIGKKIGDRLNIKSYFTDSPSTNEMQELAKFSGHKDIQRMGRFHALNQKAIARKYAKDINKKYEELNLIVCHMGGGISIGAHEKGMVVDVTDGIDEGPFTPERTGSLPIRPLIDLCYSGKYTHHQMKKFVQGEGGLNSYLKINDCRYIEEKSIENQEYKILLEAMAYQVSKEISSMNAVLKGEIDAILLTGSLSYSKLITDNIIDRVSNLAKIKIYPGERELESLVEGVLRVLSGEEELRDF